MPNGNLFQALHRRIKDWYQRYKIALGDAKGIAYLHDDGSPPIIHRDIKSSDILLDEDMNQKLLTLGLRNLQKCPLRGVIVAHLLALMAILFLESLKLLFLQDCCLISILSHGNIIFSYPMLIITANFFCEILWCCYYVLPLRAANLFNILWCSILFWQLHSFEMKCSNPCTDTLMQRWHTRLKSLKRVMYIVLVLYY